MADDFLRRNAGRLLREQWRNPVALAQELYVMMSDRQAADGSASAVSPEVQARAKPAALRELPAIPPPSSRQPSPVPAPGRQGQARSLEEALASGGHSPDTSFAPEPGLTQPIEVPLLSQPDPIGAAGKKPYTMAPPFPDWDWNLGVPGVAGTTTFIGRVVGGQSDQAQVQLYPDGSSGQPGDTVVVHILTLLATETIPFGTWVTGIQQFSDADGNIFYEAQVPVWIA